MSATSMDYPDAPADGNYDYPDELGPRPPHDRTAEMSVLGAMMLSVDAAGDVSELLSASDFYRPAHQAVYAAITTLYSRGEPSDPITVATELHQRGHLDRVGGAPYLHTMTQTCLTATSATYHAELVRQQAI